MAEQKDRKVAITGATGFVGSYLSRFFKDKGWSVIPLGRDDISAGDDRLAAKMAGVEAVVNLAGAPVISRWTAEYKKVLYDSRVKVTDNLVSGMARMEIRPSVFISTSAVGYYADQGVHTEERHLRAQGFLGELAHDWEQEAVRAEALGIRTMIFRFGVVLGKNGGPVAKMLPPFKLGLGGWIGSGRQPFSWIHINDLSRAYLEVIDSPGCAGIYNLTSPGPTTNLGLTRALGRALSRPAFLPVPAFLLKLILGEGAQILTGGQTVLPKRLMEHGFKFEYPDIQKALDDCVSG